MVAPGLHASGSSLSPLASRTHATTPAVGSRCVVEDAIGLAVALVIHLYAKPLRLVLRREAAVELMEVRAGSPPFGGDIIERFASRAGWVDEAAVGDRCGGSAGFVEVEGPIRPSGSWCSSGLPPTRPVLGDGGGRVLDGRVFHPTAGREEPRPRGRACIRAVPGPATDRRLFASPRPRSATTIRQHQPRRVRRGLRPAGRPACA